MTEQRFNPDYLFSTIKNCHFGGQLYVVYYVESHHVVDGQSPPAVPVLTWSSTSNDKNFKLLERADYHNFQIFPPTQTTRFVVWVDVAPLPTKDTVNFPVHVFGPDPSNLMTYGNQFSFQLLINHFFQNDNIVPPVSPNGYYLNLEAAQKAADYINAHFLLGAGHPAGSSLGFINSLGGITDPHPGASIQPAYALSVGPYPTDDGFAETHAGSYLLFEVPSEKTTVKFSTQVTGRHNQTAQGAGASYSKLTKQPTLASLGVTAPPPNRTMPIPQGKDDFSLADTVPPFNWVGFTQTANDVDHGGEFLSVEVDSPGHHDVTGSG